MIQKILIESDYHSHHRTGLNAPDFWMPEKGINSKFGKMQRELWNARCEILEKIGPVDAHAINGDAIDGRGEANGATELLADPSWLNQIENAEQCARQVKFKGKPRIIMSRGTPYHCGKLDDYEDLLADHLGATIKDHPFFTIGGVTFDAKHKIGSSSVPYSRGTSIARDRLWNVLWAERGEQPKADVILRCLSSDTEILSRRGWKNHSDIIIGEDVMTLNCETNEMEWSPVLDITKQSSDKEMVQVIGKGYDSLVTLDHTMLFRPSNVKGQWQKCEAASLVDRNVFQVPVSGFVNNKGVDISNEMIEVLAWVISEGGMDEGNKSNGYPGKNNLRIYQGLSGADVVEDCLQRANIQYSRYVDTSCVGREIHEENGSIYKTKEPAVSFYIRQPIGKKIISMLDGEKNIPDWLMEMNSEQFELFLDVYVAGDGHMETKPRRKQGKIFTSNKDLADRLQILLVTNGYKAYVSSRIKWDKISYVVGFVKKQHILLGQRKGGASSVVPYSGWTWCVTTRNSTIVTRRNGYVAIVGNSHVHYHSYVGGPGWVAMTTPALQAAGTKYGGRACSGTVDWGVVVFEVENGEFDWRAYLVNLKSNVVEAVQL